MFNLIRKAFTRATPAPIARDDVPAHKGFTAQVTIGANAIKHTFPTLAAAQVWIAARKCESEAWGKGLTAHGVTSKARRAYTIRNLETGKFAPYRWTVTRADMTRAAIV